MSDPESEGDSIIVGPWTQAGRNLEHYFGNLISQINLVQNDINKANARLRAERNHHKDECKQIYAEGVKLQEKFVNVAGIRLVLEQKVLRLEEAVRRLTSEKNQMTVDLDEADSSRKQLRDSVRTSGHQYERLIQDLTQSEADLYIMKQRFNALFIAYRQATGQDPPPWEPSLEGDGTLDSYLQAQKRARLVEHPDLDIGQDVQKLLTKTKAPNWGSLDPSKFTASQEEAMMQAESQKQLSPVRQTRTSRSGRADRGVPPGHAEKPKTNIFPPPPVLNLAGATIMEPVGRITRSKPATSVQSNNRNNASASSGRSPKKAAVPSSIAHLLVQPEHPAFTSNAHASTSTSHQPQTLLPAAQINEGYQYHGFTQARGATARNTSSANHSGRHQSAVVRKHLKNLEQRRKQAEAYDQAEARRSARAEQHKEELRLRKADHRAFVERRSKELQIEMGVDLGDFPPPGVPPLKDRWTTLHVGETMYAPRYVTPEPIVKTEEEQVRLNEDDPQTGADQHDEQGSRHANPPGNEDYDRDDEGEEELYHDEIAGDGDRYHEEFIPSQEGSQFEPEDDAPENTHYQFLRGDARYRYAGTAAKSTAGATDGSYTSRKSKHGERQDSPEEDIDNEVQEARPTKRRRMATQDPVPGSSNHPTALAGPSNHPTALAADPSPAIAPSAPNQPVRRSSTRISTQRRAKAAAEAKRLKGVAQYIHNAGPVPKRGWDGKVPKGANGTKEDLMSRREELHRMYVFTEDGAQEVPELTVATEFRTDDVESDLDNDPIAGQVPPLRRPAFPQPDFQYWPEHPGSRPGSPRPETLKLPAFRQL